VRLDAVGVEARVAPVGVDAATGEMIIPPDGRVVGWYAHGPSPGESGSAVLAGHVDYDGRRGAFFDLSRLEPGARVTVVLADGTENRFTVTGRRQYLKARLPATEVFVRDGPPGLVLVTCGGAFDAANRSYEANVVVYAVPS
jgi:sortase (surface protein transpeptidase)